MSDSATAAQDRLAELRDSAKGWHGIQLAALGFIGLCGVIQTGDSSAPRALQVMSGILVLVAFALACAGIYSVGRAAWPLYRGEPDAAAGEEAPIATTSRQLTRGLLMTFLSVATLALATATSWWPKEGTGASGGAAQVRVQTSDGRSACGKLSEAPQAGTLRVIADAQPVDVALGSIASVAPVEDC
jgi:hypothetical protein